MSSTHEIKFNPDKTNLMIFSPKKDDKDLILILFGQPIVRSNTIKYLGTEIKNHETRRNKREKSGHINKQLKYFRYH